MDKKFVFILILILFVAMGLLYSSYKKQSMPPEEAFAREGGLHLALEVEDPAAGRSGSGDVVDRTVDIIRVRVHQFGADKVIIHREGDRHIVVRLPGIEDVERVKRLVARRAVLELKLVRDSEELDRVLQNLDLALKGVHVGHEDIEEISPSSQPEGKTGKIDGFAIEDSVRAQAPAPAKTRGDSILEEIIPPIPGYEEIGALPEVFSEDRPFTSYILSSYHSGLIIREKNIKTINLLLASPQAKKAIPSRSEFLWSKELMPLQEGGKGKRLYFVAKRADLTGDAIVNAEIGADPDLPSGLNVLFTLNPEGAEILARLTALNIHRQLAIVLDGEVYSAPLIQTKIPGGEARITGAWSDEEAKDLAIVLRSGSLPAVITVTEARIVPPVR